MRANLISMRAADEVEFTEELAKRLRRAQTQALGVFESQVTADNALLHDTVAAARAEVTATGTHELQVAVAAARAETKVAGDLALQVAVAAARAETKVAGDLALLGAVAAARAETAGVRAETCDAGLRDRRRCC